MKYELEKALSLKFFVYKYDGIMQISPLRGLKNS
jgi:hypothetical protein